MFRVSLHADLSHFLKKTNKQENGCNFHQCDLASHLISMQSFIDLTREFENCLGLFIGLLVAERVSVVTPTPEEGSPRGGGTLEIFGWRCAAWTLEPLAYTRASSAEIC